MQIIISIMITVFEYNNISTVDIAAGIQQGKMALYFGLFLYYFKNYLNEFQTDKLAQRSNRPST